MTLAATFPAAESLRRHLADRVPDADIRVWRITHHGIHIHVGPELGLSTQYEVRPELLEVARAIDPASSWEPHDAGSYWVYRRVCHWQGVRVVVQGEGRQAPVSRPTPAPMPEGVAA